MKFQVISQILSHSTRMDLKSDKSVRFFKIPAASRKTIALRLFPDGSMSMSMKMRSFIKVFLSYISQRNMLLWGVWIFARPCQQMVSYRSYPIVVLSQGSVACALNQTPVSEAIQ